MIDIAELHKIQRAAQIALKPLAAARPVEVMSLLKPQDDDYERVFIGDAIVKARDGYAQMWTSPPGPLGRRGQTEVHAFATTADAFKSENEFSQQFPGGYRKIAEHLNPSLVWVAFKFVEPGKTSGMAYDGLVWLENRFAWFPKPWRILLAGDAMIDN
jgi:hypothetical protein